MQTPPLIVKSVQCTSGPPPSTPGEVVLPSSVLVLPDSHPQPGKCATHAASHASNACNGCGGDADVEDGAAAVGLLLLDHAVGVRLAGLEGRVELPGRAHAREVASLLEGVHRGIGRRVGSESIDGGRIRGRVAAAPVRRLRGRAAAGRQTESHEHHPRRGCHVEHPQGRRYRTRRADAGGTRMR